MTKLEQLRIDNERLQEDLAQARRDLAAGVKEGKAAIEAYRVEKARLDWLSENTVSICNHKYGDLKGDIAHHGHCYRATTLREAIEAAMKEK